MRVHDDSIFHKSSVPKNALQLFCWLVFEPTLLKRYSKTLTRKQATLSYLRAVPWILFISGVMYLLACFAIVASDAPLLFSDKFETSLFKNYHLTNGIEEKLLFTLKVGIWSFLIILAIGLAIGMTDELAARLTFGLTVGLYSGLSPWLSIWIVFYLVFFLIFGLFGGVRLGLILGLEVGLILWFGVGLFLWLGGSGILGLAVGLIYGLAWYLTFFRVYNYPWYWLRSLWRLDFYNSPYHQDELIWLPLWGAAGKFRRLAVQSPADAEKFIAFLREYRPLQKKLADQITHAAMAGAWRNQPLAFEYLNAPTIENKNFQPSEDWLNQLIQLKQQLIAYRQQIQPSLKQQQFELFQQQLAKFYQQTLVQNRRWRDEYLEALILWKQVAEEELRKLAAQAQQLEPITRNWADSKLKCNTCHPVRYANAQQAQELQPAPA